MSGVWAAQWRLLPIALEGHLRVTLIPLLLGVLCSVPLGVLATRRPRVKTGVLAVVSGVQTIPGLALLALMVPVIVAMNQLLGLHLPALGPLPVIVALTLYSMLPIVRNTVAGIDGVDPALVEAARGLGMRDVQVLRQVQLPLALPVIVAGIRTATVWTVGMATLATPVGQTSLGNYIFAGLQTRTWQAVIFGCAAAACLALVLDGLVGLAERAERLRSPRRGAVAVGGLLAIAALGLLGPALRGGSGQPVVRIGAKPFTEQYVLSAALASDLQAKGFATKRLDSLGSTVAFDALVAGEIDLYVDYSGTLWTTILKRQDVRPSGAVLDLLRERLRTEHGVVLLGALGFENAYALALPQARADALGVRSIADLAPHAPDLVLGSDYEFFQRPEWDALRTAYGLRFRATRTMDASFLFDAVRTRQADVITAYTSDGRIAADHLAVLDDPKQVLPPYDAVLLLSKDAASDPRLVAALRPWVGAVSVQTMREANRRVDAEGQTPEAAGRWLRRTALGSGESD